MSPLNPNYTKFDLYTQLRTNLVLTGDSFGIQLVPDVVPERNRQDASTIVIKVGGWIPGFGGRASQETRRNDSKLRTAEVGVFRVLEASGFATDGQVP
ncbi:hypothetical protein T265_05787 [Opisthorchis viverrini]|uniref:Uncharacterized protein n=1 Tax=Opisthorchis viverrini TaxID=6198 RepID=A0A074ZIE7_OPIVI|nr:hypothetical protein T265_05787 [Opisthorchis viverrini]KER27088.1 hypothetical protein T265_05787 [Opisthorchis viverrini]